MKILKNVLFWLSTVCLILAISLLAVPKLFGIEFRGVVTGSMSPEIPVGSLVVIVPTKAADIKIGDDISFVTQGDMVVTHRVIEVDYAKEEFITKGIANGPTAIDAPNKYENILGVVKFHIPKLGLMFDLIATLQGKIIMATVILAVYLLSCIISIWTKGKKEEAALARDSAGGAAIPEAPPKRERNQTMQRRKLRKEQEEAVQGEKQAKRMRLPSLKKEGTPKEEPKAESPGETAQADLRREDPDRRSSPSLMDSMLQDIGESSSEEPVLKETEAAAPPDLLLGELMKSFEKSNEMFRDTFEEPGAVEPEPEPEQEKGWDPEDFSFKFPD